MGLQPRVLLCTVGVGLHNRFPERPRHKDFFTLKQDGSPAPGNRGA